MYMKEIVNVYEIAKADKGLGLTPDVKIPDKGRINSKLYAWYLNKIIGFSHTVSTLDDQTYLPFNFIMNMVSMEVE